MTVGPDGYAWWYLDGISDDHSRAITIIGFIGSVFSPYYHWAGRRRPLNHVAINVALYGRGGGRWAMTERGEAALDRGPGHFAVGPSLMRWDGTGFTVDVAETAVPHLTALRGRVRVIPEAVTGIEARLSPDGAHVWRPFAPLARIEVDFTRPAWRWSGMGYLDANFGSRAMQADFPYWTWARQPRPDGASALYDVERRDGSRLELALRFSRDGAAEEADPPPRTRLPRTLWLLRRETRADPGHGAQHLMRMEDAPFYSRSTIATTLYGHTGPAVHEALDLNRFANPFIQCLLPVRMPRRAGWNRAAPTD